MESPDALRTFVALDLPETMKQRLLDVQQVLHARCPGGVMYWPPIEGFHLTLFYLGDTPAALRGSIESALTKVGQQCAPFSLLVGGSGNFPDASHPRVFWVGVRDPDGALQALYAAIRDCVGQYGYKSDYPDYLPHITLCRAESETPPETLQPFSAIARDFAVPELGTVCIEELIFYHSVPDLATSVYVPLKRIPLLGV